MAKSAWTELPTNERRALAAGWNTGVPTTASAIHARWWQFESWLRSLVYVELRSCYGVDWVKHLPKTAENRRAEDTKVHRYMSTPDATDALAYLDVGALFPLIRTYWHLFESSLLDQKVWDARVDELNRIRRRIAHCRRPHADDLGRLEQTLRDLEGGAFEAMASYNRRSSPDEKLNDELVRLWVRGEAKDFHIVDHASTQYDTRFVLTYSRRPWATKRSAREAVSGRSGYLWHACWYGAEVPDLAAWWRDGYLDVNQWRDLIVWVSASMHSIEVAFAACDDPTAVADGIGHCFQPVLQHQSRGVSNMADFDKQYRRWLDSTADLDPRVQANSGWSIVDDTTLPITIFGAEM